MTAVVGICSRDVLTDLDLHCAPRGVVGPVIPQLTDNGIDFVTSACRNLKLVCLDHCLSLTDKAARTIASNCPALQNLMLIQSCLSDDGISVVAKQCTNLNSLYVEGGLSITEVSLRALAQDAKNLKSLTLGSCPLIIEDAIMSFLMDWPYLDKLELKGMMAGESDGSLSQAYQAASQGAHFNGARRSSILHRSSYLYHELRSLILVKCPGLHDSSMFKFADIRLPMLEHLTIEDCSGVTQVGLIHLVGHAVMLKTIKLARFHFFTYAALMEVLSLCNTTIESLSLDSCDFDQVTPLQSNEAVPQECPLLEVIRLERCESMAQLFLEWIADVCRGLKELRVIGFTETAEEHDILYYLSSILYHNRVTNIELRSCQVTDIHVSIIIQFYGEALQELVSDECSHILGKFLAYLSVMCVICRNLVKLGLSGTQVTDVKIRIPLGLGFEHLPEVRLMGCHRITNAAMREYTASFLPTFRTVNNLAVLASLGTFG